MEFHQLCPRLPISSSFWCNMNLLQLLLFIPVVHSLLNCGHQSKAFCSNPLTPHCYALRKVPLMAIQQSENSNTVDVAIVGAGIGGAALASDIHKRGLNVLLLEQAESIREGGSAIGLWTQAWRALDYLGIGEVMREGYYEGTRLKLLNNQGKQLGGFDLNECDKGPHEFRYVMRAQLLRKLLEQVPNKKIMYNSKVKDVIADPTGNNRICLENGKEISARVVVGADGINSSVRSIIRPQDGKPKYAGYKAFRGISKCKPDWKGVDDNTIYQMWGQGTRMGISRMSPTEVYWFITYNSEEALDTAERDPKSRKEKALELVSGWGKNAAAIVEGTPEDSIVVGAMRDRFPELRPWGKDCVTLIGDAAHPMTPNLAQGGAAALEDAVELGYALSNLLASSSTNDKVPSSSNIQETLRTFEENRIKRLAKLNLKSFAFGAALQLPFTPITFVRNNIAVPGLFAINYLPTTFLDHTDWYPPNSSG